MSVYFLDRYTVGSRKVTSTCVCVHAHALMGNCKCDKIPGSEVHHASHATTNCSQVTLIVMVG
jgi:hypothetical protein